MRRATLCLLFVCSMLIGCAAGPQPTPAPRLFPPAHLVAIPDPPPAPASGEMEDLYENHLEAMRSYWLLRDRFQGLVDWLHSTGVLPSD